MTPNPILTKYKSQKIPIIRIIPHSIKKTNKTKIHNSPLTPFKKAPPPSPMNPTPPKTQFKLGAASRSVGRAIYRRVSELEEKEEGDEKKKQVQPQATILTIYTDFYYACSHFRVFGSGKGSLRAS